MPFEKFMPMPEELKPKEIKEEVKLTPEDLVRDSSEENIKEYVEDLLREIEETIPGIAAILEAKPGEAVARREALIDLIVRTTRVRVDGLKKGYTTPQALEQGVKDAILKQIEKYKNA